MLSNPWIAKSDKDVNCTFLSNKHFAYSKLSSSSDNKTVLIQNFDSFDELNFADCKKLVNLRVLFLIPNNPFLIDNSLNLFDLMYSLNYEYFYKKISFFKVKGFNYKHYKQFTANYNAHEIAIENGKFEFYINGTKITKELCKTENFNSKFDLFGPILILNVDAGFEKNTCPLVFKNTKLNRLSLSQISNSLILKNQLEFIDINQIELYNKNLYYLNLGLAYESLTSKLLNKYAFKYINNIVIWGIVDSIETELFKNFKYLKLLCLNVQNLRKLLENNNKWLSYLNTNVKINLNNPSSFNYNNLKNSMVLEIIQKDQDQSSGSTFTRAYTYPDEDFCLFEHFPHNHLVLPVIISGVKLECTCTVLWLIQYSKYYYSNDYKLYTVDEYTIDYTYVYGESYINHTIKFCFGNGLKQKIQACNFEQRLNKCNRSDYKYESSGGIYTLDSDIQVLFLLKWLELVIFVFLQPAFCILGIITNILTILILLKKDQKPSKDDCMNNHIFYNSVFNLIYCITTLMKLINECVFELSPFCSSVYQLHSTQYFKIVFIYFFGNAIKLCCNLSYTSFALSRFSLSANKKDGLFKKFEDLNLRRYYIFVFLVFLSFSVFNFFEYQINEIYNSFKSFPTEKYDIDNCDNNWFYCKLFRIINTINDVLKDIVFLLINLIIDLFLLKISKSNLANKIKLTQDPKKIQLAIKSNKRISHLVLVNGVVFVISYFPEFILRIFFFYYTNYLYVFCFLFISCKKIVEFGEIFNFISINLQFFLFLHFNKTFNEKFQKIKASLFRANKKAIYKS